MRRLHQSMAVERGAPDCPWRVLAEAQAIQRDDVLKTRADLQTADTFVARAHDFPTGNVLDAVNETCEVTLANAPAGNHLYEAHYKVSIDPVIPGAGTSTHKVVVAIETDLTGGGSWVEYWTAEYELVVKVGEADRVVEWKSERLTARVPSLTSSSKLRLKIKSATMPGGATFQVHGFNLATDGDPIAGVTYHTGPAFDFNENGGGAELADTVITKLSLGTHDQFETDLGGPPMVPDVAPFIVARSVWGSNDSADLVVDRFTAFLHPKQDAGQPKDVAWFVCQPYALVRAGPGGSQNQGANTEVNVELLPLSYPVYVPAGDGTSAQDYAFTWHDRDIRYGGFIIGSQRKPRPKSVRPDFVDRAYIANQLVVSTLPREEFDSSPTTFWFVWALTADYKPASNVGWARDSGTTEVTNSTRKLRTVQIRRIGNLWFAEGPTKFSATPRPAFRCKIECGSYTNANLEFTGGGNLIDLGATPTETVVFTGIAAVPEGCQGIFEVRDNADATWLPFTDGQTAAEVGVSQRQTYKVRFRALTNAQGDASPVLFEIGVNDVKKVWLGDITERVKARWYIPNLAELEPAIPELTLSLLRIGDADDFADRVSRLFAENYSSALSLRIWVGDPAHSREKWFPKDDFVLVDDYDPKRSAIELIAHSALVFTRGALPVYNVTTEKTSALVLANKTPKQLWDEIVVNQLGADIPARHRGEGFQDQSRLLSKTITDSDGQTELNAIAHITGEVVSTSAGRLKAFDMFTARGIKAYFPSEKITWRSTTPGLRQRVPEKFCRYDYREETQKYEGDARVINGTALANLKTRGVDADRNIRDSVSRWIPTEPIAKEVAKRHTDTLGGGMLVWTFTSNDLYPELELGDLVAVQTDRFVARDPTQTTLRQLKGVMWAIGRIIDYDIEGREFGIWIQSWGDFLGTSEIGVRSGIVAPSIVSARPIWRGDRLFVNWTGIAGLGSAKIATSTSAYQLAGTGTTQNGSENSFDAGPYLFGDTIYVTITPFAESGAGGRQGPAYQFRARLGQIHGMFDDATGKPERGQDYTDGKFPFISTTNNGLSADASAVDSTGAEIRKSFHKPAHTDPDHLDSIPDGLTYSRPLGTRISAGKPLIDFSEGIHIQKHLDNIADGSTYARILGNRLNAGVLKRGGALDDGLYPFIAKTVDGLQADRSSKMEGQGRTLIQALMYEIPNGGFDVWESASQPHAWTVDTGDSSAAAQETSIVFAGDSSCKFAFGSGGSAGTFRGLTTNDPTKGAFCIPLQPGTWYQFKFASRVSTLTGSPSYKATFDHGAGGTQSSTFTYRAANKYQVDYFKFLVPLNADPRSSLKIEFSRGDTNAKDFYVDAIRFADRGQQRVVILTAGSSWTVPSDFNPLNNKVELIGGGAGGAAGLTNTRAGGGGGAGGYRYQDNFSAAIGAAISYAIGAAGGGGGAGGNTTWNSGAVAANGGGAPSGATGGSGGGGSGGTGGNTGGGGGAGSSGAGNRGGGGGGGAANSGGAGGTGNNGDTSQGGKGGDGANPNGGAGGAASGGAGNNGQPGTTWTSTDDASQAGPGGGGSGGFAAVNGGVGGNYGAGGGGGGSTSGAAGGTSVGKQGCIVISWVTPVI